MTDRDVWAALSTIAPDALSDALRQLHWAAQPVGSAGRTFVEPADDDSHTSMTWDESLDALVGAPFAGPYPFRAALRAGDLTLLLLDRTGAAVSSFPLPGRRLEEAREWLRLGVATYFGGPPPQLERAGYEIPPHPVGEGGAFPTAPADALSVLGGLYGLAAGLIDDATDGIAGASTVRCWPHHFDIASLITLERDAEGVPLRTVGVGLAPDGGGYERWYWYVRLWPSPPDDALPALDLGHWHTNGWTGAVLDSDTVLSLPGEERTPAVRRFLDEATRAAIGLLQEHELPDE